MSKQSKTWLKQHARDPYVKRARGDAFRARAVYKLQEIDQKDRLFKTGQTVVDLGAAPGSWSQYAARRVGPAGTVVALDVLEMEPVNNVQFIQGDFTEEDTLAACLAVLGERKADLVISDMAPNLSGIRDADQARSLYLAELALDFAGRVLNPGGDLLVKIFEGTGVDRYREQLSESFQKVIIRKPKASRDRSREFYMLARGYDV
ncbi:MAG: RlmE family RNA methyltransferase [Gammaproteobacteria bacterium]